MTSARFSFLAVVFLAAPARAMDAYDVAAWAPADSLAVIAWSGAANAQSSFAESRMGRLWAHPGIRRFLSLPASTGWKRLCELIDEKTAPGRAELIERTLSQLWKHPSMICAFPGPADRKDASVQVLWISHTDEDAAKTADALLAWLSEMEDRPLPTRSLGELRWTQLHPDAPVYFLAKDNRWVVAVGEAAAERFARGEGASFATTPLHQRARAAIGAVRPILYACVDSREARKALIAGIAEEWQKERASLTGPSSNISPISVNPVLGAALIAGTGLLGSRESAATIAFNGDFIERTSYAKTDEGTPWPFEFIAHRPLDLALLREIPGEALSFHLTTWDPRQIYATALQATNQIWAQFHAHAPASSQPYSLDAMREGVNTFLGLDPETDIFANLGPHLLFYLLPSTLIPNVVLVLEVQDAKALEGQIERMLARMKTPPIRHQIGNYTLHTWPLLTSLGNTPFMISPCWTITQDRLMIALELGSGASYLRALATTQPSTRPNAPKPLVARFLAEYKGPPLSAISYVDERGTFLPVYAQFGMLYPVIAGKVRETERGIRFAALPTPAVIEPHLGESMSWTSVEGAVRVTHDRAGLPVITSIVSIAKVALAASITLPSLARARELSKRTVCTANLRTIGRELRAAAEDDDGKLPTDFKSLVEAGKLKPLTFVCPSSPAEVGEIDAAYAYIAGQKLSDDPSNVLVHDKLDNHGGEGAVVLFLDGRVEFVAPLEKVHSLIAETERRLGRRPASAPQADDAEP